MSRCRHRFMRRFLLIGCSIGLLMLCAEPRSIAFTYFQDSGVKVTWPAGQAIRYLSPSTFSPGSELEQLMIGAMSLWNIIPATNFQYSFARLTQDPAIDHFDGFSDTAAVSASTLDPGVIAVTFLVNQGSQWFDMDILFSDNPVGAGYSFAVSPPCDVLANPTAGAGFSFLLVAAHELGHALGMGHNPVGDEPAGTAWLATMMNPRYPSGGTIGQQNIVELHADDRNGLRFLYPPSGLSDPPVTDLAVSSFVSGAVLGRADPISIEPAVAFPGDTVMTQSMIENFGTTNELYVQQGFYLSLDPIIDVGDTFLGSLRWDLAIGDAIQFDVEVDLAPDLAAGQYYIGSILDDLNEVPELFEDNNAAVSCQPLVVAQLVPAIVTPTQQIINCDQTYVGPPQSVTHPLNMAPITWSLDTAPPGMTINTTTGALSWGSPAASPFLYAITIRATNAAGSSTATLFLGVNQSAPSMQPIADDRVSCSPMYIGPVPTLALPRCMTPIQSWSIEKGPAGMTIDPSTGVIAWPAPMPNSTPYTITLRATNSVGSGLVSFDLQALAGDVDGDGVVSLTDLFATVGCSSGPSLPIGLGCSCSDTDNDGDTDLQDVSSLLNQLEH